MNWIRIPLISFVSLSLLTFSTVASAASNPVTLKRPVRTGLPSTPAYQANTVTHDLTALKSSTKSRVVDVVIDTPAHIQALASYSQAVSNPTSPLYHHFLSPKALDATFGPTSSMIQSAKQSFTASGWTLLAVHGFIATAQVPAAASKPGLPVSPDIWAISGLKPHGLVRQKNIIQAPTRTARTNFSNRPASTPNLNVAGENFKSAPTVLQQTTASNGDVVSLMSWNPLMNQSLPAGLPVNLFVTVEDPEGNFLPISNVTNVTVNASTFVTYGAQTMPGSSNTLWQIPIAAWQSTPAGGVLSVNVAIGNGTTLSGTFPLPAFTGSSTALTPLDGQQMNALSGLSQFPAHLGAVALFAIGAPPSESDLSLYLQQNSNGNTHVPFMTFHYEDGATADEAGQSQDSEESQLDLEAVAGAAPGAPIDEYIYPENDANDPLISYLTDLSQQATAKVASLSYGFYGEDPSTLTTLMNALTAEGITLLEASGDQGAWNGGADPGPVGLSSLEQIPSVLSVGGMDVAAPATSNANGTTVTITGNPIAKAWGGDYLSGIPVSVAEAYTNQNAASSGGYSTTTPVPAWEDGFLPTNASGMGVPIIAAPAGYPGLSGILQGQSVVFGGTSLAAPLTAGWLDDVEATLNLATTGMGNINPLLFQAAKTAPTLFTQAQWGSNGVNGITNTAPGSWNPITGLGLVNWQNFLAQLHSQAPAAPASITLTTSTGHPRTGSSVQLVATASNIVEPTYQFWVKNPLDGGWRALGPYSSVNVASFNPNVPGQWTEEVFVRGLGGVTQTALNQTSVTSVQPMVSALTLSLSNSANPVPKGTSLTISATASVAGPSNPVDYQIWVHGPDNRWQIRQNYGPSPAVTLNNLAPGSYTIAVYALTNHELLAKNWSSAFYQTIVINVASRVSLQPISSLATGESEQVNAQATNLTHPVYQFWIESPTGSWQASGGYASTHSMMFSPSVAGTYTVLVYAKDPYAPATAQYSVQSEQTVTVNP